MGAYIPVQYAITAPVFEPHQQGKMMKTLKRLYYCIDGQGLVEYAMIIGLIAMVVGLVLQAIGLGIEGFFVYINRGLSRLAKIFGP